MSKKNNENAILNVAAYCRVSTDSEEQLDSYKAQMEYYTDAIAKKIDDVIKKYMISPYPIIISVPSKSGSNGYGMEGLKKAMDKALGVDILFNNKEEEGK